MCRGAAHGRALLSQTAFIIQLNVLDLRDHFAAARSCLGHARGQLFNQTLDEACMSVEFSMLAVGAERYEILRSNPRAVTDEVILRQALGHLASMSFFEKNMSEAEVLADIRANHRNLDMVEDPAMAARHVREDALVDAALARGDRGRPFTLGTNWRYLSDILADGEEPAAAEHFFFGAPRFGEDVGYGGAGLHDPTAVAAFAAYLDLWSPERFAAVAEAHRSPDLAARLGVHLLPGLSLALLDVQFFQPFKAYILAAAASRAGMLTWMS
jgi:hypothetical protein